MGHNGFRASPTTASMGCSMALPVASMGIWGMLKPKVWPPTKGTQSGMVTEMELMAPMAELIIPITALIGPFTKPTMPPQMVPKMSVTFCQAADQLAVKMLVMKLITFWRMVNSPWKAGIRKLISPVMGGITTFTRLINACPTAPSTAEMAGKMDIASCCKGAISGERAWNIWEIAPATVWPTATNTGKTFCAIWENAKMMGCKNVAND